MGIPLGANVGLFFGGIRDDKGLDLLIQAIAKLPNRHMIVAGRCVSSMQKPVSYYRELAQGLGVGEQIHFIESYIPDEHVGDYFRAADWCGLVYGESFTSQSGVLCSAVYFRTPVLVATSPTLVETVERYGVGVIAKDASVNSLTNAMIVFDGEQDMTPFFDRFDEQSNWSKNAEITYAVYQEKLKNKVSR